MLPPPVVRPSACDTFISYSLPLHLSPSPSLSLSISLSLTRFTVSRLRNKNQLRVHRSPSPRLVGGLRCPPLTFPVESGSSGGLLRGPPEHNKTTLSNSNTADLMSFDMQDIH